MSLTRLVCAPIVLIIMFPLVGAAVPARTLTLQTQIVSFNVYEDPDQENSEPIWMAVFYVTESSSNGDDIGWSFDKVKFIEVNADPTADRE